MPMSRIDRRRFVQLSGAGALTAGSGGLAGILASGRAPAYAQGSAVHSGSGPDIIMVVNNWPRLYVESLADVTDVAEAIGKEQGGYYDLAKVIDNVDGKWIGVPWAIGGGLVAYRKSWFEEIGYKDGKFPGTWDEYRDAGKKLKAKGRPFGQTAGHRSEEHTSELQSLAYLVC